MRYLQPGVLTDDGSYSSIRLYLSVDSITNGYDIVICTYLQYYAFSNTFYRITQERPDRAKCLILA